jgi:hypothetical protein
MGHIVCNANVKIGVYKSSLNGWLAQTSRWLYAACYEYRETADAEQQARHVLPPPIIHLTSLCLCTFASFTSTVPGPFYFIPTYKIECMGVKLGR